MLVHECLGLIALKKPRLRLVFRGKRFSSVTAAQVMSELGIDPDLEASQVVISVWIDEVWHTKSLIDVLLLNTNEIGA